MRLAQLCRDKLRFVPGVDARQQTAIRAGNPSVSAVDGRLSAYDDVTVTVVPPVNDAPVAVADGDRTVSRPHAALLWGGVFDDGLPYGYPLTFQWAKESGPGDVTFMTASNTTQNATYWEPVDGVDAVAFATFSAAGQYVLSLSASDTQFTNTDTLTITVLPGTNSAPHRASRS
jgi:hypothetical protein